MIAGAAGIAAAYALSAVSKPNFYVQTPTPSGRRGHEPVESANEPPKDTRAA